MKVLKLDFRLFAFSHFIIREVMRRELGIFWLIGVLRKEHFIFHLNR